MDPWPCLPPLRIFPNSLPQPSKPGLRALERVAAETIELVRTERLVADTEKNGRAAESGREAGARKCLGIAVVAVRAEATGEVAEERKFFAHSVFDDGSRQALRVYAEIAERQLL